MFDNFTTCPICYSITTYTYITEHMNWHTEHDEIEYPERSDKVDFEVEYEDSF